ncbi:hypothetical protein ACFV6F_04445 [Kitasatospora phosalacinea]|uniref:hypothetical protein n=1 Tax=Kitasatospora phosalacinea TaxID=2065 RepID=UPI003659061B
MTGRHRRPPPPAPPENATALLHAAATGLPVVEEGVVVFDGGTVPYAYRTVHRPDGRCERHLERLDPPPPPLLP